MADIYGTFHPVTAEHLFFSNAYCIFTKMGHIMGPKKSPKSFTEFKLSKVDYMELNQKYVIERFMGKPLNIWKLSNILNK